MDRKYIEAEHIVDRYLSGDLTVREAREFEQYCLDHPEALKAMPIPVRLKTRLARRPAQDSETGVFKAIPSSATHAALEVSEEGIDVEEEQREFSRVQGIGGNRTVLIGLVFALIAAVAGVVAYAMQANTLSEKIRTMERAARAEQMQAPASVKTYRMKPVRGKPAQATLNLGWMDAAAAAGAVRRRLSRQVHPVHDHHRQSRRRTRHPAAACGSRFESRAAPGAELVGIRARRLPDQDRRLQLARADRGGRVGEARAAVTC